ncbi:MAG: hypothetical protein ACM3IJ_05205 [Candidatus Levyibacteriota bacterium]
MSLAERSPRDPKSNLHIVRKTIRSRMNGQTVWAAGEPKPGKRSHIEVPFLTTDETPTTLEVTPDTVAMFAPKPVSREDFEYITRALEGRQQVYLPVGNEEEHQKTILFLRKNWRRVRRLLYPFATTGNTPPATFSEVDLGDTKKQRADFVGFGPDGRLFVVEVGTRSKSSQVYGYVDLLDKLIQQKASVTSFVAYYSANESGKSIEIRPPYIPNVERSNMALTYLHDLGVATLPIPKRPYLSQFAK